MDNFRQTSARHDARSTHSMDVSDRGQQKTVFDACEYQSGRTKEIEFPNNLILRNTAHEIAKILLLEIIYLELLAAYYERLYVNTGAFHYSRATHHPHHYFSTITQCHHFPSINQHAHFQPFNWLHHSKPLSTSTSELSPHSSFSGFSGDIVSTARNHLGQPVWAISKFASLCQRGYLGCAASVSELLHEAGLKAKGSANVAGVVSELSSLGWHKIKINDKHQFHAGDIVYGLRGSHAHIGIITAADKDKVLVCDNSSSSGTLKERTIESGGSFTPNGRFAGNLYVMRRG